VPPDRDALLIIRAWVQPGSTSPLRARLRCTTDVTTGLQCDLTLVEVDAVRTAVGVWLEEVLAAGAAETGHAAVTPQ